MAHATMILLDTSVLIDYFRKTKKERTFFVTLSENHAQFAVSVITKFEIYMGSTPQQIKFWDRIFAHLVILPFTESCAETAIQIQQSLKGTEIDLADLFIGATAKQYDLSLTTLNTKHFGRISELTLIAPDIV